MPSDQTPDQITPVPGAGEGAKQETTPVPDTKTPITESEAVKLLDSLVAASDPAPKVETPTPVKAEESAPKAETPEPTKSSPEPTEETALPELPKVRHPLSEEDDPEIEVDPKFTKIRADFDKLRDKLHKARQAGAFGRTLVDLAQREGVPPEKLAELVQKNIRLAKGDPTATAEIAAELQKRGYRLATDTEADIKTEADRIYQEQFAEGVKERYVDEEFARNKAKALAAKIVEGRPKPVPLAPTPVLEAQPANTPAALMQSAQAEVARLQSQIESSYAKNKLDFAPIQKETERRIIEKVKQEGDIHPSMWAYVYSQTVAQVQRELLSKRRASESAPIQPKNTMTPSTQVRQDTATREAYLKSIADTI